MNWQDEQFIKVYTRDTGEWTLLSWDAQALLLQILRKVDRSGVLQLGKHGVRVLPAALGHREQAERITAALAELTADGCVVLRPECLVVPNFIAAQTSRQSDKARQQSARDRRRAESMGASLPADKETSQNVTDCHLESPGVTTSHLASPRVTLDKNRIEEIRSEEIRTDTSAPSGPSQPELALVPQQAAESNHKSQSNEPGAEQSQAKPKRARTHTAIATALLGELSAARMRLNPRNKVLPPTPAHLREIERCLRDGLTVDQLRNVILVWEEMVKAGKQHPDHFDSLTPFRASNVAKYTEKILEEARRPWNQAPQATRPPEPPKSASNPPGGIDFKALREKVEAQRTPESDAKIKAELDRILGRTS